MIMLDMEKTERLALSEGWSLAELQRRAGLANTTLYKLAAGACKPRATTVGRIAKALGVNPTELVK